MVLLYAPLVLTSLVTGWVPAVPWLFAPSLTSLNDLVSLFFTLYKAHFGYLQLVSAFPRFTISKCFPEMLHVFLEKLRIATNSFGLMGESTIDTVFS